MTRRFFFFPHAVEQAAPPRLKAIPPWRVPYAVSGTLVSREVRQANGVVMGDGYQTRGGPVVVGGNQDPCIFSDPIVHSFCRIGRRLSDNFVRELDGTQLRLLPEVVDVGDVILYGKPFPKRHVAVDTVIVVREVMAFAKMRASAGMESAVYAYNLSDAQPGGWHAGQTRHTIIVGALEATKAAVDAIATSFVPNAERSVDGRWQVPRVRREHLPAAFDDLTMTFATMFSGPGRIGNAGYITELPTSSGEALARAVIARSSEGVFVPPVAPRSTPPRFSADSQVRPHELHLARLDPADHD